MKEGEGESEEESDSDDDDDDEPELKHASIRHAGGATSPLPVLGGPSS